MHVLLAEDNFINQKLEKILLMNLGCTVELANNGREAVQKVAAAHYDAVIMDVSMPVLGGIEATVEIRKAGHRDLPIIALTAFASKDDERKCMDAGMNGFIAKPIKVRDLEDVLTGILRKQS
jgi:CheY-like chemotaxis protein